jgi:hypothetical protein
MSGSLTIQLAQNKERELKRDEATSEKKKLGL